LTVDRVASTVVVTVVVAAQVFNLALWSREASVASAFTSHDVTDTILAISVAAFVLNFTVVTGEARIAGTLAIWRVASAVEAIRWAAAEPLVAVFASVAVATDAVTGFVVAGTMA
jgi:hypothetical protein